MTDWILVVILLATASQIELQMKGKHYQKKQSRWKVVKRERSNRSRCLCRSCAHIHSGDGRCYAYAVDGSRCTCSRSK
jgi:hypothetical protein